MGSSHHWWQRVFTAIFGTVLFLAANGFALTTVNGGTTPRNIYVITHAAGRMGKLLALQLREDANIAGLEMPRIRAVVRSDSEAMSVQCDLGGMTMEGGNVAPIPVDWLDIVVVKNIDDEAERTKLRNTFEGAGVAILCDSSHNEMQWDPSDEFCSIVVPAAENKDLSERLLTEIEMASSSSTLSHVVMRSSMGLAVDSKSEAGIIMGGEAALNGPLKAEERLRSSSLDYTILRLGALTDDAGMVPLIFGRDDSILLKRVDSTNTRRPPIISRADAARVCTFLSKEAAFFRGMTIDCSWHPKFGRSSVGTEEAVSFAGRQDLKKDIIERCSVDA